MSTTEANNLVLVCLTGTMAPVSILPVTGATLGRGSGCEVQVEDATVSRRHARIEWISNRWAVYDLGSRHGTRVNGLPIEGGRVTPLDNADRIGVGRWVFDVRIGSAVRGGSTTLRMTGAPGAVNRPQTIAGDELQTLASRRLRMVLDAAAKLQAEQDEASLAETLLKVVLDGGGFARAALLRAGARADEAEVLAARTARGRAETKDLNVSRTVIHAAASGDVVRLTESPSLKNAPSILGSAVGEVLCVPLKVGDEIVAFIYADSPAGSAPPKDDAAAFCAAIAHLGGLAIANLRRANLESRQREVQREMDHARRVQERIIPAMTGQIGPFRYALRAAPGRQVAGDLFGIVPLASGRVAVFLGDVSGKGMGPALLMASTQAFLQATFSAAGNPTEVMRRTNAYLIDRSAENEFVSLFVAVLDSAAGVAHCADAGHGYAVIMPHAGTPSWIEIEGGLPLGIDVDQQYATTQLPFASGDRLLLLSDGVAEQTDENGEMFGRSRIIEALSGCPDAECDVTAIIEIMDRFAGSTPRRDDVTVASIERMA